MKNTIEAVKYGIDTLKVSPEEMFSLIESSNGYEGEDYKRWLANEIIKLAEKDGVGFSQLLVKKFAIISDISDGVDAIIKPEWISEFKHLLGDDTEVVETIDFDEIETDSDVEINWYSGVDLLADRGFSENQLVDTRLLELLSSGSEGNTPFAVVARLGSDSVKKDNELFQSAKEQGVVCKSEGALLLYRMCNLVDAWELGSNFRFAFLTNANFLYNPDNKDIVSYFLKYFTYDGYAVDSVELFSESVAKNNDFVFVVCKPRVNTPMSDGFVLSVASLSDGMLTKGAEKRYSYSSESMLDYLKGHYVDICKDPIKGIDGGSLTEGMSKHKGCSYALGYLNIPDNGTYNYTVSTLPMENYRLCIPIVDKNIMEVILYYAVTQSFIGSGCSFTMNMPITGSSEYANLVYNCLPLFLFSPSSHFKAYSGVENKFDVESSDIVSKLLEDGEVYFSYESKELLDVCKGFLDFLGSGARGLSFQEVRSEANHDELNKAYLSAVNNLKSYIRGIYRKLEG